MTSTVTVALVLIAGTALSGCVSVESEQRERAHQACQTGSFPSHRAQAECYIKADAIGPDYEDLRQYRAAGLRAIAERLDSNKITPAEAALETAKMNAEIQQMGRSRLSAGRSRSITCTSFGHVTTCN